MSVAPERRIFLVNVADLLRRAGAAREVSFTAPLPAITVVDSSIPAGTQASVDLRIESLSDGLTVTGTIGSAWVGMCRRCLEVAEGTMRADVIEVYSPHPVSDEVWPLPTDQLDLYPLVTETLALELPLAPLCRPDCAGLCPVCGVNRNRDDCGHRSEAGDPRWAALAELRELGDLAERGDVPPPDPA